MAKTRDELKTQLKAGGADFVAQVETRLTKEVENVQAATEKRRTERKALGVRSAKQDREKVAAEMCKKEITWEVMQGIQAGAQRMSRWFDREYIAYGKSDALKNRKDDSTVGQPTSSKRKNDVEVEEQPEQKRRSLPATPQVVSQDEYRSRYRICH